MPARTAAGTAVLAQAQRLPRVHPHRRGRAAAVRGGRRTSSAATCPTPSCSARRTGGCGCSARWPRPRRRRQRDAGLVRRAERLGPDALRRLDGRLHLVRRRAPSRPRRRRRRAGPASPAAGRRAAAAAAVAAAPGKGARPARLRRTPDAGCGRLPRPSRHDLPRDAHRPRAAAPAAPAAVQDVQDVRVRSHLVAAVLVTLFCFAPTGVAAVVWAGNVRTRLALGDVEGARRASAIARRLCWVSVSRDAGLPAGGRGRRRTATPTPTENPANDEGPGPIGPGPSLVPGSVAAVSRPLFLRLQSVSA